jgi:hypothetical protein
MRPSLEASEVAECLKGTGLYTNDYITVTVAAVPVVVVVVVVVVVAVEVFYVTSQKNKRLIIAVIDKLQNFKFPRRQQHISQRHLGSYMKQLEQTRNS